MIRRNLALITIGVAVVAAFLAPPALAGWDDWNCGLRVYWGALGGTPEDRPICFFGVQPGATDEYDLIDSKKPSDPPGNYVYAWFHRPAWDQGRITADWRAPIPEGTSKRWGTADVDTWNVKTNLDNGPSGVFDEVCDPSHENEYPVAASVYITWEFGVAEEPPYPLPPDDYTFTLQYTGGINAKPAGTMLGDATVPTMNQTWDMEAIPYIVIPLWHNEAWWDPEGFRPYNEDCTDFLPPDTAKFFFIVDNPDTMPTCTIDVDPASPQGAPATFTFTASASGDEPLTFDWDFGDGGSDTGNPLSHTYDTWGTYTVICTVTDADGDTATCEAAVRVSGPPECCFTYTPAQPMMGELVQFTDCSTQEPPYTIVGWAWDFGDGWTSTDQNPTHTYAGGGCFEVVLTVTNSVGLSDTCTKCVPVRSQTEMPMCDGGWHMISPYCADYALADVLVRDDATGVTLPFCDAVGSLVQNPLFYYDTALAGYVLCGCEGEPPPTPDHTLRMGFGYWLYTFEPYLTLVFP